MKPSPTERGRFTGRSIGSDHELMTELIARDAQVDVINELGSTPLAEAVKWAE